MLAPAGAADTNSNAIVGHGLSFLVGRASYTFGLQVGGGSGCCAGLAVAVAMCCCCKLCRCRCLPGSHTPTTPKPPLPPYLQQGPCVSTDTACSSSLVSLHMAHSGILAAESVAGVAGGVNIMLIPQVGGWVGGMGGMQGGRSGTPHTLLLQPQTSSPPIHLQTTARICLLQALSPVARCKTFDASADGYGRGEAIALAMLQRADLVDTEGSGSGILGFVHGAAVNQDGRSSSLTAPNGPAQTALVRAALAAAAAAPQAIGFVSLHGTGGLVC